MRTPTPPLAPDQQPHDVTVYTVLNDFGQLGRAYVESDEATADEQTVINNISDGEYSNLALQSAVRPSCRAGPLGPAGVQAQLVKERSASPFRQPTRLHFGLRLRSWCGFPGSEQRAP
jgi:hypothetical protein